MKRPKLITRKRLKWTGLAATLLLGAVMVASYWLWPSYQIVHANSQTCSRASIAPGTIRFAHLDSVVRASMTLHQGWLFESRQARRSRAKSGQVKFIYPPHPSAWLPKYNSVNTSLTKQHRLIIPLWMPLALCALPTTILFYRDRKPKSGCCAKCRYDLTGLSSKLCPECGTKIATTDSHKAPASAAEGENGVT